MISKRQNTENIQDAATLWLHIKTRKLAMKQELKENGNTKILQRHFTHTSTSITHKLNTLSTTVRIKHM